MRARTLSFFGCCGFAALVFVPAVLMAQTAATLPSGWQSMSAGEFATASATFLKAGLPDEEIARASEYAWQNFLGNAEFLANGDWGAVKSLAELYATPGGLAQRTTSAESAEAQRQKLLDRLQARIMNDDRLGPSASFAQMQESHAFLKNLASPATSRADLAAGWATRQRWEAEPLQNIVWLLKASSEASLVDQNNYSAMWTGMLSVPQDGEVRFRQRRLGRMDAALQVTLDGQNVLSTPSGENEGEAELESAPIPLKAGASLPIVVQMSSHYDKVPDDWIGKVGFYPSVILEWKWGEGDWHRVPNSVYTATGDSGQEAPGLRGEYFADTKWKEAVGVRIDPGLELAWTGGNVLCTHEKERAALATHCADLARDPAFLGRIAAGNGDATVPSRETYCRIILPDLLYELPVSTQEAALQSLAAQVSLLTTIRPADMRSLLSNSYVVDDTVTLELLSNWCAVQSPPPAQVGVYPTYGQGTFISANYDDYGWVGNCLTGGKWQVAKDLLEDELAEKDGSCNRMLAYSLAFAASHEMERYELPDMIQEHLDDETVTGDARATWLMAMGFYKEMTHAGIVRPMAGLSYLQEAMLEARSPELRWHIFSEQIARHISLNEMEVAEQLMEQYQGEFGGEHAAQFAEWRSKGEELREHYKSLEQVTPGTKLLQELNLLPKRP